ncbi:MAG: hypothetical protein CVV27_08235 [Candidatus Melainabacteria bacterium HGW-Melainabacteria-1]|nr:MAG: hypothetical protein CVV27_08235 [Candidatus Melainabacteria bacterium HGW-Melainabacteria-1]
MSKLYLRLYLFAVAIMATSTILSSIAMGFVFQRDRARMLPPREALEQAREQMLLMRDLLPTDQAQQDSLLKKIALTHHWNLSRWRGGKLIQNYIGDVPDPAQTAAFFASQSEPSRWTSVQLGQDLLLIHPKPPRIGPPPTRRIEMLITPLLLTLFSLMILLIPFVQRIVKPFKHLLTSIRRVSVGNYEAPLELRAGSEFQGLADEFNHMTAQIRKTLAEKQRLIADVSHELRSPLARLRVGLELMAKKGDVPEKYFNKAVGEVEQLDALIDDLLDSSRLELRANFAPVATEMVRYLQEIFDKNQLLFAAHPLELRFVRPEREIWCEVDRDLLERACNNLFSNTLKHALPPAWIEVHLGADDGAVALSFRDSGPGIDPADCDKIFDPFYRTDDSRTRSTGGVGLGLAIVRKIIQLHRGEVWAEVPDDGLGGLQIGLRLPALLTKPGTTRQLR